MISKWESGTVLTRCDGDDESGTLGLAVSKDGSEDTLHCHNAGVQGRLRGGKASLIKVFQRETVRLGYWLEYKR